MRSRTYGAETGREISCQQGTLSEIQWVEVLSTLDRGGIVAGPTESFYGLFVRADRPLGIDRLMRVKIREHSKALPLIAGSAEIVMRCFQTTEPSRRLIARGWPGPLTLALKPRPETILAPEILFVDGTVGVRVSSHPLARELARRAGGLVTATSANLAGEPPVCAAEKLHPDLRSRVELVLDAGPTVGGKPSTVVGWRGKKFEILRPGAIDPSQIEAWQVENSQNTASS